MPATELLTSPALAANAVSDVPLDWPGFWLQMLRARDGRHTPQLSHEPDGGWSVEGAVSARTLALFDVYKPLLDARSRQRGPRGQTPWVVAQLGQSLDGFVATATGDSYYVNGAHCLLHLHRLRALCDAVLVGAGTVATDNPQLTTRRVPGPQPVRVVIDPAARLDGHARVFRDGQAPTLWVCDSRHAAQARARLEGPATVPSPFRAEVLAVDDLFATDPASGYHPHRAVDALARRGLHALFVEGGGITVSRFFTAGALDRLHLVVAPVLIGNGRRGLQVPGQAVMADCPRPMARTLALGTDMLWDLALNPSAA
ncbi:RibD family protein [Hydrogenophaga sp.]|uniref:RibD family protein n=1 Tax=Hydrogenophaga sp. TaxID=1904254 RepID=UPI002730F245|nr:RibD family protein [Hydrogenophaga sp.]MDP1688052.1 RibD family protein [Hydrogenophaga sp.]